MSNDASAAKFDLAALTDDMFTKFYTDQVEPSLKSHEDERLAGVKTFWQRLGLCLAAVVVLCGIIFAFTSFSEFFFISFIGGCVTSYWYAMGPLNKLEAVVKTQTLSTIASTIGCTYNSGGPHIGEIARYRELNLLPNSDRSSMEDAFEGERFNCAFKLYEAHLEQKHQTKNGTNWVTVFRGQLVSVRFPKEFLGVTVVRRDAGLFNMFARWGNKLQRVGLVDARFEKAFEVYSSDQVEARYLIHPVFMERLLALETQFKGKRIRCAFEKGDLLVAVEGGDRFEMGSMFEPLAQPARVRKVVNDVVEIVRLVDACLTAERAPLVALAAEKAQEKAAT